MTPPTLQQTAGEAPATLRHFKTLLREDGILLAGFDYADKSVNVLDADSLADWEAIVRRVHETDAISGVVLVSLKPDGFCAGANVELIHDAQTRGAFEAIDRLVTSVHEVFDRMDSSPKPFVAAVEGACVGGGLELALACHARVASSHPKTGFALPEVKLGILPGFGGTQRLPRLIGLPASLMLITTGKTLFARQAFKMGLVDAMVASVPARTRTLDVVQHEAVVEEALATARRLASAPRRKPRLGVATRLLALPGIRGLLCGYAARQVRTRVRRFYPAPLRAIEAVRRGWGRSVLRASRDIEQPRLLELLASRVSAHLVSLYLRGERLKKAASQSAPPDQVAVLGAGLMGGQIAGQLAEKGSTVVLRDLSPEILARALGRIQSQQAAQVKKRIIRPSDLRYRMMRVQPALRLEEVRGAAVVLEAVSEKLDVKQAVLAELETVVGPDVVFATNTSSYTLGQITEQAVHQTRCVGLHFFNPVAKMQLVEVVRAPFTSDAALGQALGLARRLGKFPLVVQDGPGFLVNRILSRYLAEAVILVSEGVSIGRVDAAAREFGMAVDSGRPMGPLELLDLIGLPVALHVLNALTVLGPRIESREVLLEGLLPQDAPPVTFWHKGRENPKAVQAIAAHRRTFGEGHGPVSGEMIHKRLIYPMIDEAVRCLQDGIVEEPWQVDFGLTYGIGFPAFRGGLLAWARESMPPAELAQELDALAVKYGKRFEPCESLVRGAWY